MKVALVAMPWARQDAPSAAIGILAAVVRREQPDYKLDCKYEFVKVSELIGSPIYQEVALRSDRMGEFIYAIHLYPQKKELVKAYFVEWMSKHSDESDWNSSFEGLFEHILGTTITHLESFVSELSGKYDVIGLTTSFNQLFASLAVSKKLKEIDSSVKIVLGGAGVASHVRVSILKEYPYVDFVVQGEGEWCFLKLLKSIETNTPTLAEASGILSQRNVNMDRDHSDTSSTLIIENAIHDLNKLPVPDYDEYAELAEKYNVHWQIPIEGSRGCWWSRVERTRNPMHACYFCGLTKSNYRQKTEKRVAWEMKVLAERYSNVRFWFVDYILRHKSVAKLAKAIKQQRKSFSFSYELRASVHPYDLMLLWEAGCTAVQIGIEGLSSAYLQRLGKGTTTIQNLQTMKTCFELGIISRSNLIVDFPGATKEEVEETVQNILNYTIAYQPTSISTFWLQISSSVYSVPEQFNVSNIRMSEEFNAILPTDVGNRLNLPWLSYDFNGEIVDWQPVRNACQQWDQLHRNLRRGMEAGLIPVQKPLYYNDGGVFLEIIDQRHFPDDSDVFILDRLWRDIYLYCMEIRRVRDVVKHFSDSCGEKEIREILDTFVKEKLLFLEKGKCLSLAVACRPQVAQERLRKARNPMAQDGHRITGIEIAPAMNAQSAAKIAKVSLYLKNSTQCNSDVNETWTPIPPFGYSTYRLQPNGART